MNADLLREQLIEEWGRALATLDKYETANDGACDSECDVGEARADEVLRVLHRIATAGGIVLPNVPYWLNKDEKVYDVRQPESVGWVAR